MSSCNVPRPSFFSSSHFISSPSSSVLISSQRRLMLFSFGHFLTTWFQPPCRLARHLSSFALSQSVATWYWPQSAAAPSVVFATVNLWPRGRCYKKRQHHRSSLHSVNLWQRGLGRKSWQHHLSSLHLFTLFRQVALAAIFLLVSQCDNARQLFKTCRMRTFLMI